MMEMKVSLNHSVFAFMTAEKINRDGKINEKEKSM